MSHVGLVQPHDQILLILEQRNLGVDYYSHQYVRDPCWATCVVVQLELFTHEDELEEVIGIIVLGLLTEVDLLLKTPELSLDHAKRC